MSIENINIYSIGHPICKFILYHIYNPIKYIILTRGDSTFNVVILSCYKEKKSGYIVKEKYVLQV